MQTLVDAAACAAGLDYRRTLRGRQEQQAQSLATLTGWDVGAIRRKMTGEQKISDTGPISLWERLFGR
jgi:hypothetical protein